MNDTNGHADGDALLARLLGDDSTEEPDEPQPQQQHRRRLPDFLRENELAALFAAALAEWQETPHWRTGWARSRKRDWLMIQTAYYAGLRVLELCQLRIEDVDLAEGILIVRHGKGDADGTVPLSAKLKPLLVEWIGQRTSGILFNGPHGQIATRHFNSRLKLLARRARIPRRVHAHLLRHTYCCHLLRKGTPQGVTIHDVSRLMRHRSLDVTARYLHFVPGKLKDAIDLL